jgi:putative ATP-dependent endonuclease of the OLD family
MRISHVRIENFRNFKLLDVELGQNVVLVGENKAGKSNFVEALRLILDPSLPDSERYLTDQDFWDGDGQLPFGGREIRVSLQFTDFAAEDPPEAVPLSWFSDCLITGKPNPVAKLTYRYYEDRKLADDPILPTLPSNQKDYAFEIFPGDEPDKDFNITGMRRSMPLYPIDALRDIAGDNRVWHRSPLNRLLKLTDLSTEQLQTYADAIKEIGEKVVHEIPSLNSLEAEIQLRVKRMIGSLYGLDPQLGLSATTPDTLREALRLFADGTQKRPLDRISLGLQNTLYLSLLSLLLEKQQIKRNNRNEPFIPIVALEEPEAHLHPHLQRLVFRDFLGEAARRKQPVVITTHSPHLASSASLADLVLLKSRTKTGGSATSAYDFVQGLDQRSRKDLERFLDLTKSEMLFSKGVIFVEGDAEVLLVSDFADILGMPLDKYGISVCNVYGAHFYHVVMLAYKFGIPCVVITDGDKFRPVTGLQRSANLLGIVRPSLKARIEALLNSHQDAHARRHLRRLGIFVNEWTLEVTLLQSGLVNELKMTFEELGQELGTRVRAGAKSIDRYVANPTDANIKRILIAAEDSRWGKGRFAQRLVNNIRGKVASLDRQDERDALIPEYIRSAIRFLVAKVELDH